MGDFCSVRLWRLKEGCAAADLEELTTSGILEMQRWMPGVKHLSLVRLSGEPEGRYLLTTTFVNAESYKKWRQVEEEGPDYWERYASIMAHWEQLSALIEDYAGETLIDAEIADAVRTEY